MMINQHIILASASPRRKQIMEMLHKEHSVVSADINEMDYPAHLQVHQLGAHLAHKKAEAVRTLVAPHDIILAADTIVALGNESLGKPANHEEAYQMLHKLSGKMHSVITGVCISAPGQNIIFSEITHVYFRQLRDDEINYYIEHFQPFDKAGGYAIQEWIGLTAIEKIKGDYFNVVGLPAFKVYAHLRQLTAAPVQ